MNETKFNELYTLKQNNTSLFQAACASYRTEPHGAIEKLNKILGDQKNLFVYFLKARALGLLRTPPEEILTVINEGLLSDPTCYFLLAEKAHHLTYGFLPLDREKVTAYLGEASECIKQALFHFTAGKHNETRKELHKITALNPELEYLNEFNSEVSLKNFGTQIGLFWLTFQASLDAQKASSNAAEALSKVEKERTRTIELLGLFTAVIAFIFSSIHFASNLKTIPEALIAIIGLGAVLLLFLLTLHIVLDDIMRGKFLREFFMILGIVIVLILLLVCGNKYVGPGETSSSKASTPPATESEPVDKAPAKTDKASKPETTRTK